MSEDATERGHLWARFEQWHDVNPHAWTLFARFTFSVIRSGRARFSARDIIHQIRWYTNVELKAVDEFKINNDWSPYYARVFMRCFPQYGDFFEVRQAEDSPEIQARLVERMSREVDLPAPTPAVPVPGPAQMESALEEMRLAHRKGFLHGAGSVALGRWLASLLAKKGE